MYKYFVSFNHSEGNSFGFGHTESITDFKIKGIKDIRELAKSIEEQLGFKNIMIINFRLFDE